MKPRSCPEDHTVQQESKNVHLKASCLSLGLVQAHVLRALVRELHKHVRLIRHVQAQLKLIVN